MGGEPTHRRGETWEDRLDPCHQDGQHRAPTRVRRLERRAVDERHGQRRQEEGFPGELHGRFHDLPRAANNKVHRRVAFSASVWSAR